MERNDNERVTYSTTTHIKFKIRKLILCCYSDVYVVTKGTLTVAESTAGTRDRINKQ